MGEETLWLILIGPCGAEKARVSLSVGPSRGALPLREIAQHGLDHQAIAVAIVRRAADEFCTPCHHEMRGIATAQRTLQPIGLRLHDYILWHGSRCVSLRLTGKL